MLIRLTDTARTSLNDASKAVYIMARRINRGEVVTATALREAVDTIDDTVSACPNLTTECKRRLENARRIMTSAIAHMAKGKPCDRNFTEFIDLGSREMGEVIALNHSWHAA